LPSAPVVKNHIHSSNRCQHISTHYLIDCLPEV
jgi:hypothetical protein